MKKIVALASALVASVLLPAGSAGAGSSTPWTTVPPDWFYGSQDCFGEISQTGLVEFPYGPGQPPFGSGSLRLYATAQDLTAVGQPLSSLGSLSAWHFSVRTTSGIDPLLVATVQTSETDFYQLLGTVETQDDVWTDIDAYTTPLRVYDQNGPTDELVSVSDWDMTSHADGPAEIAVYNAPCFLESAGGSVFLDGWTSGEGSVTTYDFERGATVSLANRVADDTIKRGSSVKVSTTAKLGGEALTDHKVTLFAKPRGADGFKPVGTAVTNDKGVASLTKKPRKTTTYQWRYAGHTSPSKKVTVKPAG